MSNRTQKLLKLAGKVGLIYGFVISIIVSIIFIKNNAHFSFLSRFVTFFYCLIYYGVVSLIICFVVTILVLIVKKRIKKHNLILILLGVLITITLFIRNYYKIFQMYITFWPLVFVSILIIVGIFLLSLFIGYIFSLLYRRNLLNKKIILYSIVVIFLIFLVCTCTIWDYKNKSRDKQPILKDTSTKFIIYGLDAGDWLFIRPLIEKGKLPNIAKIMENGASGDIETLNLPYSISIWTSIATGKSIKKHGMKDFVKWYVPGIKDPIELIPHHALLRRPIIKLVEMGMAKGVPYDRYMRTSSTIWNIFSEINKKVGIVGWWGTWPVEEVNGYIITDHFSYNVWGDKGEKYTVYPDSMYNELLKFVKKPEDVGLDRFLKTSGLNEDKENWIKTGYAIDQTTLDIGLYLLKKEDIDLLAVYTENMDAFEHAFWDYFEPEYFLNVDEKELESYSEAINNYYMWHDEMIGKFLKEMDEDTVLLLFSDNGQRKGKHDLPWNGFIMMYGKNIKKGIEINKASVYDITPTILYLNGLPLGEDMDGKVLIDAIDNRFIEKHPIRTIKTYEKQQDTQSGSENPYENEMIKRLKDLGYII